jgi:hypothetical protein
VTIDEVIRQLVKTAARSAGEPMPIKTGDGATAKPGSGVASSFDFKKN